MPQGEQEPPRRAAEEPLQPFELPPDLGAFLAETEYALLPHETDQGAVFVVKAPAADIASLAGLVPIEVVHELHEHELAPVIRTKVTIYDHPTHPLSLESFINVAEEDQWADFASLTEQKEFTFLLYDETLSHQLTKRVRNSAGKEMSQILNWADRVKASIPEERYNFDQAKAAVMAGTRM